MRQFCSVPPTARWHGAARLGGEGPAGDRERSKQKN